MNDLVFSQLEDIGNDTFKAFAPYSAHSNSSQYFDNSFSNYDNYYSGNAYQYSNSSCGMYNNNNYYTPSPSPAFYNPNLASAEVALKRLNVQDFHGKEIDARGISSVKLKLLSNFFGLEYYDSVRGRSMSQFLPNNIISFIRQCDRTGIYIHFQNKLNARIYSDDFLGNDGKHYYDSPFCNCLHLMLEFFSDSDVSHVFDYVTRTDSLMSHLKVVYNSWMLCAHFCTHQDIFVMSAQMEVSAGVSKTRNAINAQDCAVMRRDQDCDSEDDEKDDGATYVTRKIQDLALADSAESMNSSTKALLFSSPTANKSDKTIKPKPSIKTGTANWADTAKTRESAIKNQSLPAATAASVDEIQHQPASSLIDISKLDTMLPPAFVLLSKDIQQFAISLMTEGTLLPYQLTGGLCETLAIAETESAKKRAKCVLYKLSKVPAVQLTNLSNVSRFIIHGQESLQSSSMPAPAVASTPLTSTPSPHEMIDAFDASNVAPSVDPSSKEQTRFCIVS